jgi:drug/metabolite transporter, DME family
VTAPRRGTRQTAAVPRLEVLLAALCFGTTGTAQALGPDGASPLTVGAVRVALGAALLLLAVRLAAGSAPLRLARQAARRARPRRGGLPALLLRRRPRDRSRGGRVAALGSAPAFAGLGGWLVNRARQRMGGRHGARAVGVALMALGGSAAEVSLPGVVLALGTGASYAGFTLASKRLLDASAAVERVMAGVFTLGALLLVPGAHRG